MHKHEMTYLTLLATAGSAEGPMHLHSGNTCVYTMVVNYPAQVAVDLKQSGAFVTSCASWWLDRFYTQINLRVFLYQILLCMPPNGQDRKGGWCIENMVNVKKNLSVHTLSTHIAENTANLTVSIPEESCMTSTHSNGKPGLHVYLAQLMHKLTLPYLAGHTGNSCLDK